MTPAREVEADLQAAQGDRDEQLQALQASQDEAQQALTAAREALGEQTDKTDALATQLAQAVRDARRAARRDPSIVGSRERRVLRYLDALRRLETATGQLASALERGRGREDTESIAIRVRGFVRDAEQHGSGLPQSIQTKEQIAPARALLEQLAPFYFAGPAGSSPASGREGGSPAQACSSLMRV